MYYICRTCYLTYTGIYLVRPNVAYRAVYPRHYIHVDTGKYYVVDRISM